MAAKIRFKCPNCGEVANYHNAGEACAKCKQPLIDPCEGKIYVYRQGSPLGIASGFGLYFNNEPFGHIGNKELLCFPLKYGTYNIHCAAGMSRRCRDLLVTISPEAPNAYVKVFTKPGFWTNSFVVEPLDPKLLNL